MLMSEVVGKSRWAKSEFTSYLIPGLALKAVFTKTPLARAKNSRRASATF